MSWESYHDTYFTEDIEAENWLNNRPVCDSCGEPIQTEDCFEIDNRLLCEDCAWAKIDDMVEEYRKDLIADYKAKTDDFIYSLDDFY